MDRKEKLIKECEKIIDDGRKPTAEGLAKSLSWMEEDVHALLNILEKNRQIQTYSKHILGSKKRFVSLFR